MIDLGFHDVDNARRWRRLAMGNRFSMSVLLAASTVLVGAAVAVAAPAGVKVGATKYDSLSSTILVDGSGRPLYHLTSEKGKAIRCSGGCAKIWPPIIVAKGAKASAGQGVSRAKLGTIKRPDGRFQLTYAGFALYRYSGDRMGTAGGQGLSSIWFVVNSAGKIVTRAVAEEPAGGGDTGGDTTGADTGGGGYGGSGGGYG
jgi:predicted lipoprotein with Yx(FWY)xxD motif